MSGTVTSHAVSSRGDILGDERDDQLWEVAFEATSEGDWDAIIAACTSDEEPIPLDDFLNNQFDE